MRRWKCGQMSLLGPLNCRREIWAQWFSIYKSESPMNTEPKFLGRAHCRWGLGTVLGLSTHSVGYQTWI